MNYKIKSLVERFKRVNSIANNKLETYLDKTRNAGQEVYKWFDNKPIYMNPGVVVGVLGLAGFITFGVVTHSLYESSRNKLYDALEIAAGEDKKLSDDEQDYFLKEIGFSSKISKLKSDPWTTFSIRIPIPEEVSITNNRTHEDVEKVPIKNLENYIITHTTSK